MSTCQSCGKENPSDQDFCSCGEYLRWEPTGFMQAVTPEMAASGSPPEPPEAPAAPAPPPPNVTPAAPVVQPEGGNGNGHHVPAPPPPPPTTAAPVPVVQPQQQPVPAQPVARTLVYCAVPPPGAAAPAHSGPAEPATIVLR